MSNKDNPHSRGVSNDPHMGSFSATNMFVTIRGRAHKVPLNTLVLPFLVTKVNLQISQSIPIVGTELFFVPNPNKPGQFIGIPIENPNYPTFMIPFDTVEVDNFNMFEPVMIPTMTTIPGIEIPQRGAYFTIPISGWWKISYTISYIFQWTSPFIQQEVTISSWLEKILSQENSENSRELLSVGELGVLDTKAGGPFYSPTQEIRTLSNSDVLFFNAGDIFTFFGRMSRHNGDAMTSQNYVLGNYFKSDDNTLDSFQNPASINLLSSVTSSTKCSVEFVRPVNFLT